MRHVKYHNGMWIVSTTINGGRMFSSALTLQLAWDNLSQLIQRNGEIK